MRDPALVYVHAMACNNAWSNKRLLGARARLSPEAFAARRTSFFPSIQATLNHILIVDWYYVDALEGGSLGPRAWANEIPDPKIIDLSREQSAVDSCLIAFCRKLEREWLAAPVKLIRQGRIQEERADRVLLHLFQHQIHHRGQVHAMLAATEVKPPQLDEFFMADEAPLRSAELGELHLAESEIWGELV